MKNSLPFPFVAIVFILMAHSNLQSQEMELPYKEIPPYPTDYASGNLVARMIDGLGYRYYWATEGLTERDLGHTPSEESRSAMETLVHIYVLSQSILKTNQGEPILNLDRKDSHPFSELRKMTLNNFKKARDLVLSKDISDLEQLTIIFEEGGNKSEFPYWNMINGMITDCIHHTGQVVLMRRSSGNPQNPNVNVFLGKTKE